MIAVNNYIVMTRMFAKMVSECYFYGAYVGYESNLRNVVVNLMLLWILCDLAQDIKIFRRVD